MIEKKHIAIICPEFGGNGAVANVAYNHAKGLSKFFKITLVSDSFSEVQGNDFSHRQVRPWKFKWLRRFSHVPKEVAFSISARNELEKIHKEEPLDIVMCHGHPTAWIAAKPFKDKHAVKYTLTTHGDIFDRPKGTYDSRLTWFYKKATPIAYRYADLVIALSPHMRELAIGGGSSPENVIIIPNGISFNEIGLSSLSVKNFDQVNSQKIKLLFVGRLSIEKGVDILINACRLLKADGVGFLLKICGEGKEKNNLVALINKHSLNDDVKFLGRVDRKTLGNLYVSSNLTIVPSRSDPLPTVVLESMCSGTPVIGADVGGISYMIRDELTGSVVESENSQDLAEAITRLYLNREDIMNMSKNCIILIENEFSWDSVIIKIKKELVCLLQKEGQR